MNKLLIVCLIVGLSIVSCKKVIDDHVSSNHNYFGLIDGRFVVYDVFEMHHDDAINVHDTVHYQLKTWIDSIYIDNEGRTNHQFKRFKRDNDSSSWVLTDVWTAIVNGNNAELVEENQRKVKLIFPIRLNGTWNPNAYNNLGEESSTYSRVHKSLSLNGYNFDSTSTVLQKDFFSLVDCRKQWEIYAANVGLVYKYYKDLEIENFDTLSVIKGEEVHYSLIEYGAEY